MTFFCSFLDKLAYPSKINDYLASFFQNVSDKCDNKIEYYNSNSKNPNVSFSFSLTSIAEVNKMLHDIKTNAIGLIFDDAI